MPTLYELKEKMSLVGAELKVALNSNMVFLLFVMLF